MEVPGLKLHETYTFELQTAEDNGITKTALITVGRFLESEFTRSKLYDPGFSTEYREATK